MESHNQINYPRKRAPIACNFCRHRKRRCDGQTPVCGLCSEAGAQCEYQEAPPERSQPADLGAMTHLQQRLEQLEALVHKQSVDMAELSGRIMGLASPGATTFGPGGGQNPSEIVQRDVICSPASHGSIMGAVSFSTPNSNTRIPASCEKEEPLTIPLSHHTTTGSMLALDQVKELIGNYPHNFFFLLESEHRFSPKSQAAPNLQRDVTDVLVFDFFTGIHPHFPIMDREYFLSLYDTFPILHNRDDPFFSLCMVVLALGKFSSITQKPSEVKNPNWNGMEYFEVAYRTLAEEWVASCPSSPILPLALLYASIYLRYIGRPIQAWKFVHLASTGVQLLTSQYYDNLNSPEAALVGRIAWGCYLLECADLAEIHYPRSGIEIVVDGMPFPTLTDPTDRSSLMFLAMCSMRRLYNRIHSAMYATEGRQIYRAPSPSYPSISPSPQPTNISSLDGVCQELTRQLEVWAASIPASIKPNFEIPVDDPQDIQLKVRYYSARHIITRPYFLIAAQTNRSASLSEYVLSNAEICIDSCRGVTRAGTFLLKERSHYDWGRMQSLLAAIFILAIARSVPLLRDLVPDFDELINRALDSVEPLAAHSATAEALVVIFKQIREKLRLRGNRLH